MQIKGFNFLVRWNIMNDHTAHEIYCKSQDPWTINKMRYDALSLEINVSENGYL